MPNLLTLCSSSFAPSSPASPRRFYSPDVPLLQAFGSELNQVWAALIENSVDAMGDSGMLTLSTRLQGKTILSRSPIPGTEFLRSVRIAFSSPSLLRSPSARGWGWAWIPCNESSRSILARSLSIPSHTKQRFMCDCPWIALRSIETLPSLRAQGPVIHLAAGDNR